MPHMICHQVPSPDQVRAMLGMFYYWHVWLPIPQARMVCQVRQATAPIRALALAGAAGLTALAVKFHL